ncbi:MAG: serine hydrolase [Candidatus Falkowbacteria bacterium]|nr:serine hydrolase [Candidatus Falkowbacteria bacterium]
MLNSLKKPIVPILLFLFLATPALAAGLRVEMPGLKSGDWLVSEASSTPTWPWYLERLSPVFDFSLASTTILASSTPSILTTPLASTTPANPNVLIASSTMYLEMDYTKNPGWKKIYWFNNNSWQALATNDYPSENKVRAEFNSLSGRVAVLARPEILTSGSASWYKYKGGNFAASPDFKKGSVIRVYNTKNNKFIDVTINDYGPDRIKHPDRVLDLDKEAFKKIASPADGLISIRIEPLSFSLYEDEIINPINVSEPKITAKSAIIIRESDGSIIWGKNQNQVSSLASLSKIVALKVFLDTKPDLKKIVTYKKQDEQKNYEYCLPGESARLKLKEGETLSINDLMNAALVGSANNAVETLVRVSGLSRADFIKKMNAWVKKIGAVNTTFVEPTGLSPSNMSSPQDYAIITKEAFKNSVLQKISVTWTYKFTTRNTKKVHTLTNTDRLLDLKKYKIIGSKTGYLEEAGYCLMTRVATPRGNIIIVNFGSDSSSASFRDNEQLIRYGSKILNK